MWKRMASWLFSAACILFLTDSALGAEIVAREPCDISLTGVLQPGDSDVFKSLLSEGPCAYSTLRLDSPGGSLSEALKIAEAIYRTRTVIEDGAECLSACAILFMTGRACSGSPFTCNPLREMHPNAVLGFHAPFLETAGGDWLVPRDLSFSQAVGTLAEILDRLAGISTEVRMTGYDKDIIPSDLLTRMFVTPPQAFYFVETNDQFYAWDIDLIEDKRIPGEPALTETQVGTLCYNLVFSEMRGWRPTAEGYGGFGDFSDEMDDVAGGFGARTLDAASLPDGFSPKARAYSMSFQNLNMGPGVSGWCRVTPDLWSRRAGYFNVAFRGDFGALDPGIDPGDGVTRMPPAPLSFDATLHYSMAFPPGTPVRSLSVR